MIEHLGFKDPCFPGISECSTDSFHPNELIRCFIRSIIENIFYPLRSLLLTIIFLGGLFLLTIRITNLIKDNYELLLSIQSSIRKKVTWSRVNLNLSHFNIIFNLTSCNITDYEYFHKTNGRKYPTYDKLRNLESAHYQNSLFSQGLET